MDSKKFTLGILSTLTLFGITTIDSSLLWQDNKDNPYAHNSLIANNTEECGPIELSAMEDQLFKERLENISTEVPLEFNQTIKRSILAYLHNKKRTERVIGLCQVYKPLFENVLAEYQMPQVILNLPIIESELNVHAVSPVGAMGLWQFMESTGKLYDLDVNSHIDERKDPEKATIAAAQYLKHLHGRFGDWLLALAAYNCGPGRVSGAIKKAGGKKNYWDIRKYLPRETRGYVPKFIAATYVNNYYFLHGLSPKVPELSMDFAYYVTTHQAMTIDTFAENNNVFASSIKRLNPFLLSELIPANTKLKMPFSEYEMNNQVYTPPSESTQINIREEVDTFAKISPIVPDFVEGGELDLAIEGLN